LIINRETNLKNRILTWAVQNHNRIQTFTKLSYILLPLIALFVAFYFEDWRVRRFLLFYLTPLLFIFPFWTWYRFREIQHLPFACIVLDGLVVTLAVLRIVTGVVPYSGHMLFLVYSGITQKEWLYRIVAFALLIETTYFKWSIWNDLLSWGIGLSMGLMAAIAYILFKKYTSRATAHNKQNNGAGQLSQ
jgi:hypothetical protein